jgi:hypothetical protein
MEQLIKMYCTNRAKIIPFPNVSFIPGDDFQNTLDRFLNEMGYIETPEVRGNLQSGSIKNEIDGFLREMGYIAAPEKQHIKRHMKGGF